MSEHKAEKDAGLTHEQDAALDRLAEAIASHIKAPCDEPAPCLFHQASRPIPPATDRTANS